MAEKTVEALTVRKLADTSEGTRVVRFDPVTGEKLLVNPDTNAVEPWPLAGVEIVGNVPTFTAVPTSWVGKAKAEGWLTLEGERVEHRPGGPADNVWGTTHTFIHADAIVIHTVGGDVRFKVAKNPDKFADDSLVENDGRKTEDGLKVVPNSFDALEPVTPELYEAGQTRVDWFYELELDA